MEKRFRQAFARREPVREAYDTVLIVCEGEKTEPNYFNGLRAALRLSSANIKISPARGSDPMSVVEYAEEEMRKYDYQRSFCVFDSMGNNNFAAAVRRIAQSRAGRAGRWEAITSTPCFEVWLWLHFHFSTAPIVAAGQQSAGERMVHTLKAHFPDYTKGCNAYDLVAPRTNTAIVNARRLILHNVSSGATNPATKVHTLVEYLRNLKQD